MSRPPSILRRLSGALLDALAPHLCPLCGSPVGLDEGACDSCLDTLPPAPFPNDLTAKLGASIANIEKIGARWNFTLDSPVQELVHTLKYEGVRSLARQMGTHLGLMLSQFPEFAHTTHVVPVPLHRSRLRERGYNQAEEIARGVAGKLGCEVATLLRRQHATRTQTRLNAGERGRNVSDAFVLSAPVPAGSVLLICDDVCTTGATLAACAAVLSKAGARHILAATLAHDDPAP